MQNRMPRLSTTVFVAMIGFMLGAWSCQQAEPRPDDGRRKVHDDPAKEVLVLVDATAKADPDPVYVSWDGTGPHKAKYVRWVATKSGAILTITVVGPAPAPAPTPPPGHCPVFPKIACSDGQCISRDLTPNHMDCAYKYKVCVDSTCQDPTIMIDP